MTYFMSPFSKPIQQTFFCRQPQPEPAVLFDDGPEEFTVEKILSHQKQRGKLQYLIKKESYADHENTWEKTANLNNCDKILQDYNEWRRMLSLRGGGMW